MTMSVRFILGYVVHRLVIIIQPSTKKDKIAVRISSWMAVFMMQIWLIYDKNITKIWWKYD